MMTLFRIILTWSPVVLVGVIPWFLIEPTTFWQKITAGVLTWLWGCFVVIIALCILSPGDINRRPIQARIPRRDFSRSADIHDFFKRDSDG